jgi:hypothetical protein
MLHAPASCANRYRFAVIRDAPSAAQPGVNDLPLIPALVLEIPKRRLRIVQFKKEL